MATTVDTIVDRINVELPADASAVQDAFSDTELEEYVRGHIISDDFNVSPDLAVSGDIYTWNKAEHTALYKPTITNPEGGVDYRIRTTRGAVTVTSGNATQDQLDIEALLVDWHKVMYEVLRALATDTSRVAMIVSSDSSRVDTTELKDQIMDMATTYRGPVGA